LSHDPSFLTTCQKPQVPFIKYKPHSPTHSHGQAAIKRRTLIFGMGC